MAFIDPTVEMSVEAAFGSSASLIISPIGTDLGASFYLSGDLVEACFITGVRVISSTRIRIDFSRTVDKNSALEAISGYLLETVTAGAVDITILDVIVPTLSYPKSVDLIVSEMTDGVTYSVSIASLEITSDDTPISDEAVTFVGEGEIPTITAVVATSSTEAQVRISEVIRDSASVRNTGNYSFDNGLTVVEISEVEDGVITLTTSEQVSGTLYTLTFSGVIRDYANNQLVVPVDSLMLGYTEPEEVLGALNLNIYDFLMQSIRDSDQKDGFAFLERYLEGPQAVWEAVHAAILQLPQLWSVTQMPDPTLTYQKNIVGWTKELDRITSRLSDVTLRRLIEESVPFWKSRGPETSIEDILRLTTGARVRILNWFDYRWLVGETHFGEEYDGHDSWAIGTDNEESHTYQIRIVDDETLDRELVRALVRLTRPANERVEIAYMGFMDLFTTDDDKSQWEDEEGESVVADGYLRLPALVSPEVSYANISAASGWSNYVSIWRACGDTSFDLLFYRASEDDNYFLRVTTSLTSPSGHGRVELFKTVSGTETSLVVVDLSDDYDLYDDVYHGFRIEAVKDNSDTRIRVLLDANMIIDTTDDAHFSGGIGFRRLVGSGVADLDLVELFFVPAEPDLIDINS
jgi:hypothetical protein